MANYKLIPALKKKKITNHLKKYIEMLTPELSTRRKARIVSSVLSFFLLHSCVFFKRLQMASVFHLQNSSQHASSL